MKHVFYLLIAVFMVSCGSNSSTSSYEKTITDNLLKGSDTKENLNFKIIEISETGNVTVADSIAYLTDEFQKNNRPNISKIELAKKMSEDLLAREKNQAKIDKYNADIARMSNTIDSLKNLTPDNLNGYDSKNPNDVLAVIVRCKYSIAPSGTAVEETFDFYLSPDGSKCYGKTRAK